MNRFQSINKDQSGVTILLAVMMIAGITIITMTVAFFMIQELRSTRASALTEPAIVAAETAGEQGIFRLKRANTTTTLVDCNTNPAYTQLDDTGSQPNSGDTWIKKCKTYQSVLFQVEDDSPAIIYLYDDTNVNGNTCMEDLQPAGTTCDSSTGLGTGAQLFNNISVNYLTGSFPITVMVETLDGAEVHNQTYTPGASINVGINANILGAADERLKITISVSSGSGTVEVNATGPARSGLPDYQVIDAEACKSTSNVPRSTGCNSAGEIYKRRINITIPR